MTAPLVSCIMPTANRRAFVPQAIRYFLRQDYAPRELVIVDDGTDPVADLVPDTAEIRYLRLPARATVGAKRNLACEHARGSIIVHWDDDDWYAPDRVRIQVEALLHSGAGLCGVNAVLFYDLERRCAWRYTYPPDQRVWVLGSTLCYTREFWEAHRFGDVNVGEDAWFVWNAPPAQVAVLRDAAFHVGIMHGQNVSPKETHTVWWSPAPLEEVRRRVGEDWRFYQAEEGCGPGFFTMARKSDLALREFQACNQGQPLPWMRRWELPYALFQARLGDGMSVLDCTINPVDFERRLLALYPHTLYRRWNPIQNGAFAEPFGVPDDAFDRVFCINTLEHLLRPQRETLVASMARKLKPGGWLVLTSDYYFDSSWEKRPFLDLGVMRADRAEVFNGWNKITPQDWIEISARHGLTPLAGPPPEPREEDASLYCNAEPYAHACIAGVFAKGEAPAPRRKKVVLSLLTWNTRAVSLESLDSHVQEARTLQRLGQEPLICVCDNGSNDGTAEHLRQLDRELDIPHRFILNPENLGNSIARNQIVDYALGTGADYLLFLDGDIEIVPFSSFAMLRYMEGCGRRLGCLGANSCGQTNRRAQASPSLYSVQGLSIETTNLVAWTQYGMFRRAVFEEGVRFDEHEPFNRAGWGFEDNDFAFQMELQGFLNQYFTGMTYLHRDARSSIRIMRERGLDPLALYRRRKQYVIEKWAGVAGIENGPLVHVRAVEMPR